MATELLTRYTPNIASLTLIPSSGGRFEVKADGALLFSKKALGRHAQPGEIATLLEDQLGFVAMPADEAEH